MKLQILISILMGLSIVQANASLLEIDNSKLDNGRIILEANDAGEVVSVTPEEYTLMTGQSYLDNLTAGFFDFKKDFYKVTSYITPTMESEFDVFIMINVDHEGRFKGSHDIPAQHMKVLRRSSEGQAIFKRNANGSVVGLRSGVLGNDGQGAFSALSDLMPISSGAGHFGNDGQAYVDTPTGIYRINHSRSDGRRYGKGMWHSLYFDLVYPWGKTSGLAVHGTSKSQYKNLGRQRSHGCVRTTQAQASSMYESLINDDTWWSNDLPDMNNRVRLKSDNGRVRGGARALIILFYGYGA